jgi:hypothetical protein
MTDMDIDLLAVEYFYVCKYVINNNLHILAILQHHILYFAYSE